MGSHADRIPVEAAVEIIRELRAYPTWALEVALLCRVPDWQEMRPEVARRMNIEEYLPLADEIGTQISTVSIGMPDVARL